MQVSHLAHSDRGIRCKTCGAEFEVSRQVLRNPLQLLARKEGIAASHSCRKVRLTMPVVRVLRPGVVSLETYWNGAMRRLTPAPN